MNEEAGFVAALAANPSDQTAALVFADWLDERSDPRGAMMRVPDIRVWMHPTYENPLPNLLAALEKGKRVERATKALALLGETAVPGLRLLFSHKSVIVRTRAAKAVHLMGPRGTAALPALMELAKDPDWTVRRQAGAAAKAIVRGGGVELTQLREALHDADGAVRRQAAALIGTMRARRTVKSELAKGLDSPDPAARLAAVDAMGQLRTKTAVDALCKALADPADAVRLAAVRQLSKLVGPTTTVAIEPLRKSLADTVAEVRDTAMSALREIRTAAAAAVPDVIRHISGVSGQARAAAFVTLFSIGAGLPEVRDLAIGVLHDSDERVRYAAWLALPSWKTYPASAMPALLDLVRRPNVHNSPTPAYRPPDYVLRVRTGLQALARISGPPPKVWDEFRSQLLRGNADVAAGVLAEVGPAAVALLPELTAALTRSDPYEGRGTVGKALGRLGAEGIAALVKALDRGPGTGAEDAGSADDLYWRSRNAVPAAAAEGLEEVGPAALPALPALLDRLRRPMHPQVRAVVVRAIGKMGPDAASAIPDLIALLEGDRLPYHGASVFSALHQIGAATVPFVPQLTALLTRPERAQSHGDVVRLLAALSPHGIDVLPALREVLRRATAESAATVARAAVRGLADLGPAAAPALPDLMRAYESFVSNPPADLRPHVLAAYGKIGRAAIPHIRAALSHWTWQIRAAAVEALGASGDRSDDTLTALRVAETDAAKKVRARATAVLKKLAPPTTKPTRSGRRPSPSTPNLTGAPCDATS